MTTAIIDYGSGNLRSAAKAFERAAGENGSRRNDPRDQQAGGGRRGRPHRAAGGRRLRRLPARARRGAGPRSGARRGGDRARPAVSRHLRRHAVDGRARPRIRDGRRARLDRRRGRGDRAAPTRRSRSRIWAGTSCRLARRIRCSPGCRPGPTPISCTAITSGRPIRPICSPTTDYGGPLTAAVGRDNLVGTQFHPEKSQAAGLRLIANFLGWRP